MASDTVETPLDLIEFTMVLGRWAMTLTLFVVFVPVVLAYCVAGMVRGGIHGSRVMWACLWKVWTAPNPVEE